MKSCSRHIWGGGSILHHAPCHPMLLQRGGDTPPPPALAPPKPPWLGAANPGCIFPGCVIPCHRLLWAVLEPGRSLMVPDLARLVPTSSPPRVAAGSGPPPPLTTAHHPHPVPQFPRLGLTLPPSCCPGWELERPDSALAGPLQWAERQNCQKKRNYKKTTKFSGGGGAAFPSPPPLGRGRMRPRPRVPSRLLPNP